MKSVSIESIQEQKPNNELDNLEKLEQLEPTVDRLNIPKTDVLNNMCGNSTLEDNSLDNFREHHASADHSDSLQPRLIQNPFQPMDSSEIKGYDESESVHSVLS